MFYLCIFSYYLLNRAYNKLTMFNYYKKCEPFFLAKKLANESSRFPNPVSTKKFTSHGHYIPDFTG